MKVNLKMFLALKVVLKATTCALCPQNLLIESESEYLYLEMYNSISSEKSRLTKITKYVHVIYNKITQ